MASFIATLWQFFTVVLQTLFDVLLFWVRKLREHWFRPSAFRRLLEALENATTYEQWKDAAIKLDTLLGLDMWRNNPTSKDYDFRLINDRLSLIDDARQAGDVYGLINALRAGLVRNLGNINSPKLFNKAFAGTKYLIHEYISQYVDAIEELTSLPPPDDSDADLLGGGTMSPDYEDGEISGGGFGAEPVGHSTHNRTRQRTGGMAKATMSAQNKLDFIHDSRQGFGRTALVLQGGAIFGLCHLGVVKALLLQGLLPRIIVGTATGAIMGALVSVHPDKDLLRILNDNEIDVSAFASHGSDPDKHNVEVRQSMYTRWETLLRRIQRFRKEGYFLDVTILEECVRANIGDLTFEEAFNRSKRILNITVVPAGQEGLPTLLNYITAPNVLVWTAAVASNASSSAFYGHRQTKIMCKDAHGNITPWSHTSEVDFRHWTLAKYTGRDAPLPRVARLFNVNHYIVSQARPYLVPFLQSDMHGPSTIGKRNKLTAAKAFVMRMVGLEVRHRLRQMDRLRLLQPSIRRFLVDEHLPGPSMTLVPQISLQDFARLMETPTKETVEHWILRGERSVWPAVAALKARCAIEMELDRAYQDVRRLKAGDLRRRASETPALAGQQLDQQHASASGSSDTER